MADPTLAILTYIGVILLIGILGTIISQKLKISNVLILVLVGIILGQLDYNGGKLFAFPALFLTSISILALVMIIFDSTSRFKFREFDILSFKALRLASVFLLLNLIFLSAASYLIFKDINNIFLAVLFAGLMSGTDPSAILVVFKGVKNRLIELVEIESIINTPIVVIIPFIVLDLIAEKSTFTFSEFINQLTPFLQQIITGIGAGIFIGIIVFRLMRKQYSETISPLTIITSALLTYIIAENIGGNGVLAVTTLGLVFGNIYIKEKSHLKQFSSIFANSLEILVFVLIGLIIRIPLTFNFFLKSFALFLIYLIIRFISVYVSYKSFKYSVKQMLFVTFNCQKGIAVAVIAFTLSTLNIAGIQPILNLTLIFMLYSLILSTFFNKVAQSFITAELQPAPAASKKAKK